MSATDDRDELCEAIRQLSQTAGQMRFGQLLAAAGELCADMHGRGLWEATDSELLEAVWKLNEDLKQNASSAVKESA